ncbi:LysR family transcriptional regulator [Rhodoligotrophos ferricapiens]|uniref:LysR family transcriptional regulator n=1 Tax=Rhodoligotrophos ferricapiens TaxID=3069264 RepID=UPI00315CAA52
MHWDHARYFLAVARLGTLRAAARALGVDQATVGRRLAMLEEQLGAKLFVKMPNQFALSPVGEALVTDAEAMEQAVAAFMRKSAGVDLDLAGPVRIAATEVLAELFILPVIAALRDRHPHIDTGLMTIAKPDEPSWRNAHLALRTVRPENGDYISRRLARLEVGLFAAPAYLEQRGTPVAGAAFAGHDLVIYQRDGASYRWDHLCGEPIASGNIALQVTTSAMLHGAVLAGMGIGAVPVLQARRSGLVRVLPERSDEEPVWLVVRGDLYGAARIRVVSEAIGAYARSL